MTREQLLEFLSKHRLAVQASVADGGAPQAAVIGVVVSPSFEVFFDTDVPARKTRNLRRDGRIALVFGWDMEEAQTVLFEGVADEPAGADLERLKQLYFARFPDGRAREASGGITYFRIQPTFVRYSDFRGAAPHIQEWTGEALLALRAGASG